MVNIEITHRGFHIATYEIPEFIDSLVLFDRSTEVIRVRNATLGEYVVTLYTPFNTYINFIYTDTKVNKKTSNDDENDEDDIYLESREFIRGIVRRNVKEEYKYNIELNVDHDINYYKNDCSSLAENKINDIVVQCLLEYNTYKTYDTLKKTEISDLHQEIKRLREILDDPLRDMTQTNNELWNLRNTINTLNKQLTDSYNKSKIISAIIGVLILYKLRPYFLHWWYGERSWSLEN